MINSPLAIFFITVFSTLGFILPYSNKTQDLPQTKQDREEIILNDSFSAQSILVFDIKSGERVVDIDSDDVFGIASLSKIMTGYLALEYLSPDDAIEISPEAHTTAGAVGGFRAGELFSLKDLLRAMMMSSSNDAAMAVAEAVGKKLGGATSDDRMEIFVRLMNEKARALHMDNTVFQNPTGLDLPSGIPSNYSSASDLARLIFASQETPLLWEVSRENDRIIYSYQDDSHRLINLNEVMGRIPYFIGGKTGTTDASGESLVLLYESPLGTRKAFILLNASHGRRFLEASSLLARVTTMLP